MTKPVVTIEQAAAMSFEPMQLDGMMSSAVFQERASDLFSMLSIATKFLTLDAGKTASVLLECYPDDPTELFGIIDENKAWLEGFANVLGCVQARMIVALSQSVVQA